MEIHLDFYGFVLSSIIYLLCVFLLYIFRRTYQENSDTIFFFVIPLNLPCTSLTRQEPHHRDQALIFHV